MDCVEDMHVTLDWDLWATCNLAPTSWYTHVSTFSYLSNSILTLQRPTETWLPVRP